MFEPNTLQNSPWEPLEEDTEILTICFNVFDRCLPPSGLPGGADVRSKWDATGLAVFLWQLWVP